MQSKIQKWGNSLALRIPKSFANEIGLVDDAPIEISLVDGKLIIMPLLQQVYSLDELLSRVTEENIHDEQDTGVAQGSEAW
jgi:antitoxin MazE